MKTKLQKKIEIAKTYTGGMGHIFGCQAGDDINKKCICGKTDVYELIQKAAAQAKEIKKLRAEVKDLRYNLAVYYR